MAFLKHKSPTVKWQMKIHRQISCISFEVPPPTRNKTRFRVGKEKQQQQHQQ